MRLLIKGGHTGGAGQRAPAFLCQALIYYLSLRFDFYRQTSEQKKKPNFFVECSLNTNCYFRLGTGWSVHTNKLSSFHKNDQLSGDEQEHIMNVIAKAEYLEQVEQERIG